MEYIDIAKKEHKGVQSIAPKRKNKRKRAIVSLVVVVVLLGTFGLFGDSVKAIFNPISIVGGITGSTLKETDGRTNILILGSDKRSTGDVSSTLTDTILVASIGRVEKDVVLLSLPRDLWVKSPQGYYTKINAVYAYGQSEDTTKVVENVLGIPIHYHAVINFGLFKEAIDILGGIEVDVENAFVDTRYPIEGKETAPLEERYETIEFKAGKQMMDGETALKYVRSRKGNNNEGTDFARSARQQRAILAVKNKALTLDTIININKLQQLYESYKNNVDTNMEFADIQSFYLLSQQIQFDKVTSIVLDDRSASEEGGLLFAPENREMYNGAYVLIPKLGVNDFSQMHAYIQRYIFGQN